MSDSEYTEEHYLAGPLTFIEQIDLEEVSSLAGCLLTLPAEGLLLFFATPQKVDHPHTGSVGPDWLVEYLRNRCPVSPAIPPVLPAEFSEKVIGHFTALSVISGFIVGGSVTTENTKITED